MVRLREKFVWGDPSCPVHAASSMGQLAGENFYVTAILEAGIY